MEVADLKRDKKAIMAALEVQPDGSVIAKRNLEVHMPKRFVESGLATIGERVETMSVLGITIPGIAYAPFITLLDCVLSPLDIREEIIKGTVYNVLEFAEGDVVIDNLTVIQDPNKPYYFFMEFLYYARIPWYMSVNDLTSIYDLAKVQSGSDVGPSPQAVRVLMALMLRDPDNLDNPYRYSKAMLEGRPPSIVGLNNKAMLVNGVFSKISSGYLHDNIVGAIINPDNTVTELEKIMKGIPI